MSRRGESGIREIEIQRRKSELKSEKTRISKGRPVIRMDWV